MSNTVTYYLRKDKPNWQFAILYKFVIDYDKDWRTGASYYYTDDARGWNVFCENTTIGLAREFWDERVKDGFIRHIVK